MIAAPTSSFNVREFVENGQAEIKTGPFGTQLHASDYVASGIPVINVRNIGFGTIRPDKLEHVDVPTAERLSSHILRHGDIVFGRKGAVERHVLIRADQDGWFQGSDCIRLRFCSPEIDSRFVSYSFLTESHKSWMINQGSHGATMGSLNQDIIGRIPLILPPFPVQRRIADILSAHDDLIENNNHRIAILEEMAQNLYREWFVHFRFPGHEHVKMVDSELGPIPEGWEVKPATEAVEFSPKVKIPRDGVKPFVPMASLSEVSMLITGVQAREGNSGSKFQNGDTLFARITPCLENGKTGFVQFLGSDDSVAFGSTEFIVMRSKTVTPEYVYLLSRSDPFRDNAIKSMSGATGRQRVREAALAQFAVPQPDQRLLRRFTEAVRPMFGSVSLLADRNQRLQDSRDLLLPKLVSGELELTEHCPSAEVNA